jgi:hypothetical protein
MVKKKGDNRQITLSSGFTLVIETSLHTGLKIRVLSKEGGELIYPCCPDEDNTVHQYFIGLSTYKKLLRDHHGLGLIRLKNKRGDKKKNIKRYRVTKLRKPKPIGREKGESVGAH